MARDVQRLAIDAFRAVDGAGLARVDFLVDAQTADMFVNEINTMPGFTTISMYSKLWEASGLSYPRAARSAGRSSRSSGTPRSSSCASPLSEPTRSDARLSSRNAAARSIDR